MTALSEENTAAITQNRKGTEDKEGEECVQAFGNFQLAEASCVLKMNAFSIIRAFAFLKNVTFFLKEFKSLNLNSFHTFLTLTFSEDKFMKNEQEGFLVMSYNELVLGDA